MGDLRIRTIRSGQEGSLSDLIRGFIAQHLRMDFEDISMDAHFRDDLGLDYLDVVELAILLEKQFAKGHTVDEVEEIEFVGGLIRQIEKASTKASTAPSEDC